MSSPEHSELPRFLVAVQRYQTFLETYDGAPENVVQRTEHFYDIMGLCNELGRVAQEYDFVQTVPGLQDAEPERLTGIKLLGILTDPAIPNAVSDIYIDLYGHDLQAYLEPDAI